ncbi:MAG: YbaY family lipoprotein [Rhizobiaceae bacterium]|jgi:putative lipoprotein|nr:YbaY family lipoprotein [Rhizobiaceae bacterium]
MVVSKLAELLVFGFAPLALGLMMSGTADAEERIIQGEITYRERIALPPNAVVTVELADVSLADAPASVIGRQEIKNPGQVPIKFAISYDAGVIQPKMAYAVQARITVDNQLWFINDTRYAVDPLSPQPATLVLKSSRQNQ